MLDAATVLIQPRTVTRRQHKQRLVEAVAVGDNNFLRQEDAPQFSLTLHSRPINFCGINRTLTTWSNNKTLARS